MRAPRCRTARELASRCGAPAGRPRAGGRLIPQKLHDLLEPLVLSDERLEFPDPLLDLLSDVLRYGHRVPPELTVTPIPREPRVMPARTAIPRAPTAPCSQIRRGSHD